MPIVDVQIIVADGGAVPEGTAKSLAEALALVFFAPPARVWVKVEALPESRYAENGDAVRLRPVFLRVLHADGLAPEALAAQAAAISRAVGACLSCAPDLVHVEYAPPGRGRVAFGGNLLQ
jgi:phenylpyruvate tautomerase PptA (4-oxalocrotonate tautomerase family)